MKENTGAAVRVLASFGVIALVLVLAIAAAKWIQSSADKPAPSADAQIADAAPDMDEDAGDAAAASDDGGTDAARPEALCESIAKEIEVTATRKLGAVAADAAGWLLPDLFRDAHCVATRSGGVWAMVPTGVRETDASSDLEVLWDVVHISAKGDRMTLSQPPFVSSVDRSLDLEQPMVFDYDGDGEDEVILTGASWVREGISSPYGRVWTWKGKSRIEPYARAPEFGAAEDVDDDGRPDLFTNGPFVEATPFESGCGTEAHRVAGPLLLLHSKPDGTFSATDDDAIAYAKKACPARPKAILSSGADAGSKPVRDASAQAASPDNLACARIWGMSEQDLTAMVTKECKAFRPIDGAASPDGGKMDAGKSDAGKAACSGELVCDEWARFRSWTRAKPPLTLK